MQPDEMAGRRAQSVVAATGATTMSASEVVARPLPTGRGRRVCAVIGIDAMSR